MRILFVHNYYQQRGGEDSVFEAEIELLRSHGHTVFTHTAHNEDIHHLSAVRVGVETVWNYSAARSLANFVTTHKIKVVHFHNTFPRISPAAYRAVRRAGAIVVQTLHNYRLLCAGALLYRDGNVCEDCLGRAIPWKGVIRRCYRNSMMATATVSIMQMYHRLLQTWSQDVDAFIALTESAKYRFEANLIPSDRIHVIGNFLHDGPPCKPPEENGPMLFIGRLDQAKGLNTLLEAWQTSPKEVPQLIIAGDGPMADDVRYACQNNPNIIWKGFCGKDLISELLNQCTAVLMPSLWYEGFPMVLLEAWRAGRPVIASNIGALRELISEPHLGLKFEPGNKDALVESVLRFIKSPQPNHNDIEQHFKKYFSAETHAIQLQKLYTRQSI